MTNAGVIGLLKSGINNCSVTARDVQTAEVIYGESMASLKGRTKKRASVISSVQVMPRVTQVQQVLSVDIFFVKGLAFLLGVMTPLGLSQCRYIESKGSGEIANGIRSFLGSAKSKGFDCTVLKSDGEGGVEAMREELHMLGVIVEIAGPGQHVPVVERMIQTIKQRVRAHEGTLPFVMPKTILMWCVIFCVSRVNLQPSATREDRTSPNEQFTGVKLDAKRDLRCRFGDYVQATVAMTDNTMAARTQGCVALFPTGNMTGSVKMFCLGTKSVVTRDQFKILPMPEEVCQHLTRLAREQGYTRGTDVLAPAPREVAVGTGAETPDGTDALPDMMRIETRDPEEKTEGARDETAETTETEVRAVDPEETTPQVVAEPRRSARIAGRSEAGHMVFAMSVRAAMRERRDDAEPVIMAELQQMHDKRVWHGVLAAELSQEERRSVIRSSMFLKDKYLATGEFEKFKARLVAGGDQQDKGLYENLSSPTVATQSVFAVAAIAAKQERSVKVIDIGGAFLNASMEPTGVKVHMRLDRLMTSMMVAIWSGYAKFVETNGSMLVRLDKALYGCVEAAALWHDNLTRCLRSMGFKANPYDQCVMNRTDEEGQTTIAMHVDDLLVTSVSEATIAEVQAHLKSVYKEISVHDGQVVNYVGTTLDFRERGAVRITMQNCVDDIIAGSGATKPKVTPATSELFRVREEPLLEPAEAKSFHTRVAKLQYLAKRVRPECLTAVAFLSTRVKSPDRDDMKKLERLEGYVLGTRSEGVKLEIGDAIVVRAYIDAAYGVHEDSGKSHSGCVIVVGERGPVFAQSTKQRIVTKSSTEAELVALSDSASQVLHLRNFLIEQGHQQGPAVIYQDNMSCLALLKRGGPGSARSRHINVRHFWVCEKIADGELIVEHLGTARMFSNVLTKPVQGAQFAREKRGVSNW